ncbi:MAG: NACHT domain-containing protein [Gammaproteobacteria bacterium]|nr:NACHT domain-containing protein [Gammaproteobacteria bacterium]MBU1723547.1 NACHT domain-containing protein [Gammaproteobacteria bacterium]MBU2004105.1 NACHT domain-containing protein [Gammaproteobacteria bacterium]
MFDRERYLEFVLNQPEAKTCGENYISTLQVELVENGNHHRESSDVLTALREHAEKHVVLLGKPGSGKSTALKRLLREEADRCLQNTNQRIPVLLELRRLDENTTIDQLLAKALSVPRYRVNPENITDLLDEDHFLLLLDGLNELPSGSGLYDWRKDFAHIPMIFTSRELGVETYLGIDVRFYMLPLAEDQVKEFIKKRLGDELAFGMLQSLRGRIKELTDRPLLLDMLSTTYQSSGNIPHNQGELFRQFTHGLYENHKPKDTVTPQHSKFFDFRDEILQELAFFMMDAGGNGKNLWLQVTRTDAERWLEQCFRGRGLSDTPIRVKQWLDDALNLHLLQHATEKNKIEFSHQFFQEYYAAEWLLRHLDSRSDDQLCAHFLNPIKWTESIFILMDFISDAEKAGCIVKLAIKVDITLAAKLSGRSKGENEKNLFKIFHSRVEKENKKTYLELMAANGTKYAVEKMVNILRQETVQYHTWQSCFDTIISVNCESSHNYLTHCLKTNCDHLSGTVITDIMITLWRFEQIDHIIEIFSMQPILEELSYSNLNWIVKESKSDIHRGFLLKIINAKNADNECFFCFQLKAIEALGNFSANKVSDDLIILLNDNKSPIQIMATKILGIVRSEKAIEPLLNIIYYSKRSRKVHFTKRRGVGFQCNYKLYTDILHEAAKSLQMISPGHAEKEVLSYLKNSNDYLEQIAYIIALGFIGSVDSLFILIELAINYNETEEVTAYPQRINRRSQSETATPEDYYNTIIDSIKLISPRMGRKAIPLLIKSIGEIKCIPKIIGDILNINVSGLFSHRYIIPNTSQSELNEEIDKIIKAMGDVVPKLLSYAECEYIILDLLNSGKFALSNAPLNKDHGNFIRRSKPAYKSEKDELDDKIRSLTFVNDVLLLKTDPFSSEKLLQDELVGISKQTSESDPNHGFKKIIEYSFSELNNNSSNLNFFVEIITHFSSIEDWPRFLKWLSTDEGKEYNTSERALKLRERHKYYSHEWFETRQQIPRNFSTKESAVNNQPDNALVKKEFSPLILTEGKTDWKHLEAALPKLQKKGLFNTLKLELSKTEEHMGYAHMLDHCKALSKSPQNRLIICIFDRDEDKINNEFKVKNSSDRGFVYYGNNVFITRIPQLIESEDRISIENYYSINDLSRKDAQGRTLRRVGYKVTNEQSPADLSKNDFAENIRKETPEFNDVDVSNFAKIFELIETIIEEATKPR